MKQTYFNIPGWFNYHESYDMIVDQIDSNGKIVEIGSFLGLDDNQEVLGYLYIGTPAGDNKKIPQLDPKDFVKKL